MDFIRIYNANISPYEICERLLKKNNSLKESVNFLGEDITDFTQYFEKISKNNYVKKLK